MKTLSCSDDCGGTVRVMAGIQKKRCNSCRISDRRRGQDGRPKGVIDMPAAEIEAAIERNLAALRRRSVA